MTIESDDNNIFSRLKLAWNKQVKEKRIELFNLKNRDCQESFKEATTAENNNKFLSSVFDKNEDLNLKCF